MTAAASFPRQFASDNCAGICPESLAALLAANTGHAASYGADRWTQEAAALVRETFERDCEVFFVFTGTAANALAVAGICQPFESVLCHEHAHLATDECGAPGFFAHGTTLVLVPGVAGKLRPDIVAEFAKGGRPVHHSRPRALSLTQATEFGTVYTVEEISSLVEVARRMGLAIHMDGARFWNAVASLDANPADLTWRAGVDVLSLGGTKIGLPFGEALVFFDKDLAHQFEYRRKQSGQLASKMRFLAAPWIGLLRDGAWLRYATHANSMAAAIEHSLCDIPGIQLVYPRDANAVFATLPEVISGGLQRAGWSFHSDVGPGGAARLMCAWDTQVSDVQNFTDEARRLAELPASGGR